MFFYVALTHKTTGRKLDAVVKAYDRNYAVRRVFDLKPTLKPENWTVIGCDFQPGYRGEERIA